MLKVVWVNFVDEEQLFQVDILCCQLSHKPGKLNEGVWICPRTA